MSEAAVPIRIAATNARLSAILRTVFVVSAMFGLSSRSPDWLSISFAPSGQVVPHPAFFLKQSQPPPYSAFPLMIAGLPHFGHLRVAWRNAYLVSRVEHRPLAEVTTCPVARRVSVHSEITS